MKLAALKVILAWLTPVFLFAQQDTEVYLVDILSNENGTTLGTPVNITNNAGYDNQPSFLDEDHILFSSTRNGQTDIALYSISKDTKTWISNTPGGSEYSPLKIPGKEGVSAIRLDADGLQRLYQYDLQTGKSKELLKELKVGYHVWYNDHILVCTVLVENRMDLVVAKLKEGTNYTVEKNVGRSLHKIPDSDLVSYISKAEKPFEIKSLNPITQATKTLNYIWNGTEDITWFSDNTILATTEKAVVQVPADTTGIWHAFHQFEPLELYNMSRMAVSPNGEKLAIVAEPSPDKIVQKQVERFNARDLDGFVNCYTSDVLVTNFPSDTISIGRIALKEGYKGFYDKTANVEVKVSNRIVIGSTVIDQEVVTINDQRYLQVAVYEIDGRIKSMRFIREKKREEDPEIIVQKQLDAYNARDIEGFLAAYTNDVKLYNFPGALNSDGLDAMREGYGGMFASTPDLHADISNRIVIGNIVIDKEEVTANGYKFSAVAIYEVENGKISKVTFVR